MDRKQLIATLRDELKMLETKHKQLEITVKTWNEDRRIIDEKIQKAEHEMLALRIEAWREYNESGKQFELKL